MLVHILSVNNAPSAPAVMEWYQPKMEVFITLVKWFPDDGLAKCWQLIKTDGARIGNDDTIGALIVR